ncbi:hypothetical protein JAVIER_122 [Vibrio phage Javier]|uniref:Uncharacterized protein n=2 Tax=Thalassavirus TaxID=2948922 RepID=A0A4Y6E8K3_9CAUD|nr:hypothetical protein KNU52_gp165 [Vibrio phage Achelous]YP_010102543.1 hypothetical protein KNU58_gp162 [Vibrio phage Brizo]QIG66423.1 hypothetical protein CHAZLY21_128 [Vibrio phage Chazly21]QQO89944.1 hypothetical protein ABURR_130 [Vibrio phage ABurr]WBF69479.1 hypothetical protein IW18_126 [Vibrio phage IW18]WBU76537.1 hypothetical protein CHLORIS_124 [Vibrio phage Chloris]WBU76723.1 hypothetical protein JAVIER_122 [Vibrio phage Javier]
MSKALFDLVTELREKDMKAHSLALSYLEDFDTMLLVEPTKKLASPSLENNYRGRLALYFEKEFSQHMAIPEYRGTYIKEYSLEGIDYENRTIMLESWVGDSCETLRVPVFDFAKLREIQEVANEIATKLNVFHENRKEEKEAKAKEERRNQYLELQKEFGDE